MPTHEERVGLNEAVFRQVNERINELTSELDLRGEPLDLVCECADASCAERISMTVGEYEELRANPRHFAVYPRHEDTGVEEVVQRRNGYDIVRKHEGAPARIAEDTDPRAD